MYKPSSANSSHAPVFVATQYAAFEMRAVPVNVNYRYLDDELWYLLDNADAEALALASLVAALGKLRELVRLHRTTNAAAYAVERLRRRARVVPVARAGA